MHVFGLELDYSVGYLELLEGEVVLELAIEDLDLQQADIDVVGVPHKDLVVLLAVELYQRTPQDLERPLNEPERLL